MVNPGNRIPETVNPGIPETVSFGIQETVNPGESRKPEIALSAPACSAAPPDTHRIRTDNAV
jgi:hypothetical protein